MWGIILEIRKEINSYRRAWLLQERILFLGIRIPRKDPCFLVDLYPKGAYWEFLRAELSARETGFKAGMFARMFPGFR
jgi:hypothetical protein